VIFRTGGRADILPGRVAPAILEQWRYDLDRSASAFAADRSAIYGGFHLYRRAR
jgi:S-adenosylmethionine-diacylglycerol 3-amino-3-carboxypropyl transferase